MTGKLSGKVAIVTGGNSGIGAETARVFAREGAHVVLMARRVDQGERVADEIRGEGNTATYIHADVADSSSVNEAVAKAAAEHSAIDILFNNAGYGAGAVFPDETDESFMSVLGVNMGGTFNVTRAVWPHLVAAGGGSVINMSSVAAQRGFSSKMRDVAGTASLSYYAAKAGVDGMTRYLASIGGEYGIRVNCVRPGQIITPGATRGGTQPEHVFKKAFDEFQILEGAGYSADVASAVLFLASDESRFITGDFLNIDGGIAAKL